MPVGRPPGPVPQLPVEMPNHSAVTRTCLGTVTVTLITRCSPQPTSYLVKGACPGKAAESPLTDMTYVSLGGGSGAHGVAAAQAGGGEQPATASAATKTAHASATAPRAGRPPIPRKTPHPVLRRPVGGMGCMPCPLRARSHGGTRGIAVTRGQADMAGSLR
jgi:hypothetical protein